MKLVVDSNVILSGLIRDGKTRALLIDSPFDLYAPETLINEIKKYKDYILKKSGLAEGEFEVLFSLLMEKVKVVSREKYLDFVGKANEVMGGIDKGDVTFIALALSFDNDGIWSDDVHFFKQDIVKVYRTCDLIWKFGL